MAGRSGGGRSRRCSDTDRLDAKRGSWVEQKSMKKNFFFNLTGMALPIISSLITVPIYIHQMGVDRYGVLSVVWILLGYLGFLDFGLSRASAHALARLVHAPPEERGRVLMSALYLNTMLGLVGAIAIYFAAGLFFERFFGLPPAIWAEVQASLLWMSGMLPLALLTGVGIGALESRERFLAANILQTSALVSGQVLPAIAAIYISPSLDTVLPVAFAVRITALVMLFLVLARSEKLRFYRYDRAAGRSLFQYGAWATVTNVVSPIVTWLDQFVLGAKLGAAAVSFYAVPMNLATRMQIVAAAMSRAVFPRFARYDAVEARDLASRATVALAYLFGACCAAGLLLVGPFLSIWISPDFAATAAPVGRVLILGGWINGLAFISLSLLQGQGRPDLVARIHVLELIPFIGVLWVLVDRYGIMGAAWAWTLRVSVDALLLMWIGGIARQIAAALLPVLLMLICCFLIADSAGNVPEWRPLWQAVLAFAVTAPVGLIVDRRLRAMALQIWTGLRQRRTS